MEQMSTILGDVQRKAAEKSDLALVYQNAKLLSIKDLGAIPYPEWFLRPKAAPSENGKNGRLRYERDFLLQFRSVCKVKPALFIDPSSWIAHRSSKHGAPPHTPYATPHGPAKPRLNQRARSTLSQPAMIQPRFALQSGQHTSSEVGAGQPGPSLAASEGNQKVSNRFRTKRGRKHPPQVKGTDGVYQSEPTCVYGH